MEEVKASETSAEGPGINVIPAGGSSTTGLPYGGPPQNAPPPTIFINGKDGDDANDGLSKETAVRTALEVLRRRANGVFPKQGAVNISNIQGWELSLIFSPPPNRATLRKLEQMERKGTLAGAFQRQEKQRAKKRR